MMVGSRFTGPRYSAMARAMSASIAALSSTAEPAARMRASSISERAACRACLSPFDLDQFRPTLHLLSPCVFQAPSSNALPIVTSTRNPVIHDLQRYAGEFGYLMRPGYTSRQQCQRHTPCLTIDRIRHLMFIKTHFRPCGQRTTAAHNRKSPRHNAIPHGTLSNQPRNAKPLARPVSRPRFLPQQARLGRSEDQLGAQARRRASNRRSPNE